MMTIRHISSFTFTADHSLAKLVLCGLFLCAGSGCKKALREAARKAAEADRSGGSALASAPTLTWKDSEVSFSGLKAKGRFAIRGTAYEISFSDLPADAKLTVGGKNVPMSSSGYVSTKIDLSQQLGDIAAKDAFDSHFRLDPQTKIALEFSPTAKVAFDAPAESTSYGLGELYKKVPDVPVAFAASAPSAHSIVNLVLTPEVSGPAKTLKDIDWVATSENLPPRKGRVCTGYTKSGTEKGPERSYVLLMVDQKVSVYEVATSKLVEAKEFKAPDTCPMMTFGGEAKSYAVSAEQHAWLRALRTQTK
jgi:hypothetical protein